MSAKKIIAWLFLFSLYTALCHFLAVVTTAEYGGNFRAWFVFFEIVTAGLPALVALAIAVIVETR